MDRQEKEIASLTLKSLANHFNIDRIKKYGSVHHQPLPSKFKLPNTNSNLPKKGGKIQTGSTTVGTTTTNVNNNNNTAIASCRSAKIRPQLNPNARKITPKPKRCKASVILDQIPVCKLQKTLIKYGCCHNMMQNVISLDYFEYSCNDENDDEQDNIDINCCANKENI